MITVILINDYPALSRFHEHISITVEYAQNSTVIRLQHHLHTPYSHRTQIETIPKVLVQR